VGYAEGRRLKGKSISGDGEGDKKILRILPRKLLTSSFSAFARLEFGSEPARALRLRDSMEKLGEGELT
jgi:hypothetical protein